MAGRARSGDPKGLDTKLPVVEELPSRATRKLSPPDTTDLSTVNPREVSNTSSPVVDIPVRNDGTNQGGTNLKLGQQLPDSTNTAVEKPGPTLY